MWSSPGPRKDGPGVAAVSGDEQLPSVVPTEGRTLQFAFRVAGGLSFAWVSNAGRRLGRHTHSSREEVRWGPLRPEPAAGRTDAHRRSADSGTCCSVDADGPSGSRANGSLHGAWCVLHCHTERWAVFGHGDGRLINWWTRADERG